MSPPAEAEPAATTGGDVPKGPQRHEEDRARIRKIIMLQSAAGVWTIDDLLVRTTCTAHNHTPPALPCGYYKVMVAVSPS